MKVYVYLLFVQVTSYHDFERVITFDATRLPYLHGKFFHWNLVWRVNKLSQPLLKKLRVDNQSYPLFMYLFVNLNKFKSLISGYIYVDELK